MGSLIIFILFFSFICAYGGERSGHGSWVGGRCEYRNYKGAAKISSIIKVGEGGDPLEDKFEVRFFFLPEEEIKESFAKVEGRELVLRIRDRSHFGSRFLNQNHVQVGATIDCILKVITRGTCTPVLFEFPSVKAEGE